MAPYAIVRWVKTRGRLGYVGSVIGAEWWWHNNRTFGGELATRATAMKGGRRRLS